ncbi:sigma factor-like helix-turn-helix DNA-binding protein [Ureibacillus aquaedulcis]|uniref:Sigma factor-like helix-turn-helix DNA-binding protein n=1 Tax=Ureibacillus aquaedulcis TaxID=3058421 RepID=A0ABT8GT25_9BACL|nr:sigma factor-like helix-turn-helix DNA-binding protein [Ureibacillus sp. BA0131]MDN4494577.1 sigma factor-like helix-turn-helix DNA-binding protein [Ureibacillus sp. BA0131]
MVDTQFKNPLLKAFLDELEHLELYQQYCKSPNEWLKKLIDERFMQFYIRIRAISYFSKIIYFTARHFDMERRKYEKRYVLTLDGSSSDGNGSKKEGTSTLKELIVDESATVHFPDKLNDELNQYIQHPLLYKAVQSLNKRQQQILFLAYVLNISDTEISKKLNVTQQAISKSKNNALAKVRRLINA